MTHAMKQRIRKTLVLGFSALTLPFSGVSLTPAHADQTNLSAHSEYFTVLDDRAWITDIGVLLYTDRDQDGFFSGIALSIDADTAYNSYAVYATIDIFQNHGDNAQSLHTTREFDLFGDSITDEYRIDIDLIRDFSPDQYDLQVQLIDASNDEIIDQVSAADFRNLRSLSLESEENEDLFVPVTDQPVASVEANVRVVEYAGSTGFWILAIFTTSLALRHRVRSV